MVFDRLCVLHDCDATGGWGWGGGVCYTGKRHVNVQSLGNTDTDAWDTTLSESRKCMSALGFRFNTLFHRFLSKGVFCRVRASSNIRLRKQLTLPDFRTSFIRAFCFVLPWCSPWNVIADNNHFHVAECAIRHMTHPTRSKTFLLCQLQQLWIKCECIVIENGDKCPDDIESKHFWNCSKFLLEYTAQQPKDSHLHSLRCSRCQKIHHENGHCNVRQNVRHTQKARF